MSVDTNYARRTLLTAYAELEELGRHVGGPPARELAIAKTAVEDALIRLARAKALAENPESSLLENTTRAAEDSLGGKDD